MAATAAPAARLRWGQVIAWRAARHHLDERAPAKAMLEVVAGIAGLHAQVLSSAELTLAARVEDLEPTPSAAPCGPSAAWSRPGPCAAPCTCSRRPSSPLAGRPVDQARLGDRGLAAGLRRSP